MLSTLSKKYYAKSLGIERFREEDTFITSYPKSGNTWVRFILANMLSVELITMKNVNQFIPGIYNFAEQINFAPSPRFIKSHDAVFKPYLRYIYIHRDYRDVLISYYHYQKSNGHFSGTFLEFTTSTQLNSFGGWKRHVNRALEFKKKHPHQMLLLSYEDMVLNLRKHVLEITKYTSLTPKKEIDHIVDLCTFQKLSENEARHGNVFNIKTLKFFRSGEREQWRYQFPRELQKEVLRTHGDLLQELGYNLE